MTRNALVTTPNLIPLIESSLGKDVDYYAMLGLDPSASKEDIRKKKEQFAIHHPDKSTYCLSKLIYKESMKAFAVLEKEKDIYDLVRSPREFKEIKEKAEFAVLSDLVKEVDYSILKEIPLDHSLPLEEKAKKFIQSYETAYLSRLKTSLYKLAGETIDDTLLRRAVSYKKGASAESIYREYQMQIALNKANQNLCKSNPVNHHKKKKQKTHITKYLKTGAKVALSACTLGLAYLAYRYITPSITPENIKTTLYVASPLAVGLPSIGLTLNSKLETKYEDAGLIAGLAGGIGAVTGFAMATPLSITLGFGAIALSLYSAYKAGEMQKGEFFPEIRENQ